MRVEERWVAKITDQQIVREVLAGNDGCFKILVQRYQEPIARLAFFHLKDIHQAEDITQETFLRAYTYLSGYKTEQSMRNWLFAIAANLCRKWHRQRIFTVPLKSIFHLQASECVEKEVLHSAEIHETKALLNSLPAKESIVLVLCYINGLTIREVAEVLGIPEGTVKSRLNRGLGRLRQSVFAEHAVGRE